MVCIFVCSSCLMHVCVHMCVCVYDICGIWGDAYVMCMYVVECLYMVCIEYMYVVYVCM